MSSLSSRGIARGRGGGYGGGGDGGGGGGYSGGGGGRMSAAQYHAQYHGLTDHYAAAAAAAAEPLAAVSAHPQYAAAGRAVGPAPAGYAAYGYHQGGCGGVGGGGDGIGSGGGGGGGAVDHFGTGPGPFHAGFASNSAPHPYGGAGTILAGTSAADFYNPYAPQHQGYGGLGR